MKRSVNVRLSCFAYEAVAGEGKGGGERVPARVVRAIRCYLNDKSSGGVGWPYPRFMRDQGLGEDVPMQLTVDDDLWRSLEEEAERQGVSVQQMVGHAALYVAAEVNAGRITRRILEDLDDGAEEEQLVR